MSSIKTPVFVKLEENTPIGQGQASFISRNRRPPVPGVSLNIQAQREGLCRTKGVCVIRAEAGS